MKTLWREDVQRELASRIARLSPDAAPRWGRMSAQQMVCHLRLNMKMALGEQPVTIRWTPFRLPLVKQFLIYYAPFPKNVPTAPELIVTATPNGWDADIRDLSALIVQCAACYRHAPWPDHPVFGAMSGNQWGVLVYRHTDHHLRQFGV
jgi:hypothetical protein